MEKNKAKVIIQQHVSKMISDLDNNEVNICWIGEKAEEILTDIIFSTLSFAKDVENYMEKEGMINDGELK